MNQLDSTLTQLMRGVPAKFGKAGDQFALEYLMYGTNKAQDVPANGDAYAQEILAQQVNVSSVTVEPFDLGYETPNGKQAYEVHTIITDDTFANDSQTIDTMKGYFDSYFSYYFDILRSQILSSSVSPNSSPAITVKPVTVIPKSVVIAPTTSSDPTATAAAAKSPQSWFDKNFFNGAGALTGAGIGILVIAGAVILTQGKK